MSTFGDQTLEERLAEEILGTIKSFRWNPAPKADSAIRSLIMVLDLISEYYDSDEEVE